MIKMLNYSAGNRIARVKWGQGLPSKRHHFRDETPSRKDDEAAKRTLMVSLCRNERTVIILGSLYAVLIKIVRVARNLSPRKFCALSFAMLFLLSIPFVSFI